MVGSYSFLREEENWEFRAFLKNCDIPSRQIDRVVHQIYRKVRVEIDCKTCMNCCKELQPVLDEEDVKNLAEGIGITIDQLRNQYLIRSQGENGYIFKNKPCPFLKDNSCIIDEFRPKDCRTFPHIFKEGFVFRLIGIIENCAICPITFHVYEKLKEKIWDRKISRF